MRKLNLLLLITFLLPSCAPIVRATPTLLPTQAATLTPTNTPTNTPTPISTLTPTPKIYILRMEFSTTSDWSRLSINDTRAIKNVHVVDKQGDFEDVSVTKNNILISQPTDPVLSNPDIEIKITVDYYITDNGSNSSITFYLYKGAVNNTTIRFYNVLNGTPYLLLDEVYRDGSVKGHEDVNPYKFSFDLTPLFQDVAAIATLTQPKARTGKFIFEYYKVAYEKLFPDLKGELNVFTSNWDGTDLTPVTNGLNGFNRIENISPDGKMVLVSSRSSYLAKGDLYLIHLNLPGPDPIRLVGGMETTSRQAIFLDNARVMYIGKGREGYGFYTANIDGTDPKRIGGPTGRVWWIVSSDKTRVYWVAIKQMRFYDSTGSLYAYGDTETLWWTNLDGSGQGKLESNGQQIIGSYAFSHVGNRLAWIPAQYESGCTNSDFYTKWITEGTYTEWAALSPALASRHGIPEAWLNQTIDMNFVNDYMRQCFILYVAPLSDLDNSTKVVLMPPTNLIKGDFTFGRGYNLTWKPDGTMLLLFNNGHEGYFVGIDHEPLLYHINLTDTKPQLVEYRHSLFSRSSARQVYMIGLSPDGKQALIANRAGGPYIRILDLDTLTFSDLFGNNLTPDSDVGRIGSIYWLP